VHGLSYELDSVDIAVNSGFDYRLKKHCTWALTLGLTHFFQSFSIFGAISSSLLILEKAGTHEDHSSSRAGTHDLLPTAC
jgi:hypothetical protein